MNSDKPSQFQVTTSYSRFDFSHLPYNRRSGETNRTNNASPSSPVDGTQTSRGTGSATPSMTSIPPQSANTNKTSSSPQPNTTQTASHNGSPASVTNQGWGKGYTMSCWSSASLESTQNSRSTGSPTPPLAPGWSRSGRESNCAVNRWGSSTFGSPIGSGNQPATARPLAAPVVDRRNPEYRYRYRLNSARLQTELKYVTRSGYPDMRFKVNREAFARDDRGELYLIHERVRGGPDMRFRVNKGAFRVIGRSYAPWRIDRSYGNY
jgi:hypothetical protein